MSQSIVSPENQNVTFVELFFDLVFVFSVTQVVGLLHDGLQWLLIVQAVLVFWLVWWAWTQFTWALNAADTTHPLIQLGTLLATAVAFFMAVALPAAFGDRAIWFAVTYVIVRLIGMTIYVGVAAETPSLRSGLRAFSLVSIGGLIAVLAGAIIGGPWQFWLWAGAILLDVLAAAVGGQSEGWNLHPEHFGERHALFVIIALGETLIVAAGRVTGAAWTADLIVLAILAVAITCGLWWSYFPRAKPILDYALASSRGVEQSTMARDAYSLLHFPMLLGVIAYAFAVETTIAYPGQPLPLDGRIALALGLVLFVGGMALAIWRATRRLLLLRVLVIGGTAAAVILLSGVSGLVSMAVVLLGVVLIVIVEQRSLELNGG